MFHICQNDSSGFAFMRGRFRLPGEGETRAIMDANDARRMLYGNMAGADHSAIGTCAAPWRWPVRVADHCLYTHPAV
ncbi:hypothetical protein [Rhodanobacter soli]|jgi:hypothetical protein